MVDLVLSHVQAVDCVCLVLDGVVQLTGKKGHSIEHWPGTVGCL